jgi:hypothetical protein
MSWEQKYWRNLENALGEYGTDYFILTYELWLLTLKQQKIRTIGVKSRSHKGPQYLGGAGATRARNILEEPEPHARARNILLEPGPQNDTVVLATTIGENC